MNIKSAGIFVSQNSRARPLLLVKKQYIEFTVKS